MTSAEIDKLEQLFCNGIILEEQYKAIISDLNGKPTPKRPVIEASPSELNDLQPQVEEFLKNFRNPTAQQEALSKFNKFPSIEKEPTVIWVVVPLLTLLKSTTPQIQADAALALSKIVRVKLTHKTLVECDSAIPIIIELLSSPHAQVQEQAARALESISRGSAETRDLILLNLNALPNVLNLISNAPNIDVVRAGTSALASLVRKPPPPLSRTFSAVPILAHLINSTDSEIQVDALWALSCIADQSNDNHQVGDLTRIDALINAGIVRRVVELLVCGNVLIQIPALNIIGDIATGDRAQTQCLINQSALVPLGKLLSSPKRSIQKEACWTISNITAGSALPPATGRSICQWLINSPQVV